MAPRLRDDLTTVTARDPASRSRLETALTYPGLHALWAYRGAHWLWQHHYRFAARLVSWVAHILTGVDIHPAAVIGERVFIDHATGVVIGETTRVGDDVTIYQGVTLGGTSLERVKRHPTIGDRVTIGAGAKILGPVTIGADSRIGANAVVVQSVPANSVVVGIPGRVISRSRTGVAASLDGGEDRVPDPVGLSLESLFARVHELEECVGTPGIVHEVRPSSSGVWSGDDFSI